MEEKEDMPPFWLETNNTPRRSDRLRQRRGKVSSIFINSGVFLMVLVVIAFVFVFFIIPSFVSFTSQIFRPHSVKRSWDSLNLVLVLFAIVCGFLSRGNNNGANESISSYDDKNLSSVPQDVQKSYPSTPHGWYEHRQDRTGHGGTLTRLRSFRSYPDLRQESLDRWRFYDDTHLNSYRFSNFSQLYHDQQQQPEDPGKLEQEQEEATGNTKDIAVDTLSTRNEEVSFTPLITASPPPPEPSTPPPPPPSPPPPVRPKVARRKVMNRTYQHVGHEKGPVEDKYVGIKNFYILPPSPLPPPPPPPPPPTFSKRRGKDFLTSLRRRKKKQKEKSVENLDWLFSQEHLSTLSFLPPSSSPPPPPPPPPHLFQNLFSPKKRKTKKIHSIPPPPPPPPPAPFTSLLSKSTSKNVLLPLEARASKANVQVAQAVVHKSPKPVRTRSVSNVQENIDTGNSSPLIPIPPPPPPPPFRIPAWKFMFDGDNVLVGSFNSSRSGSPDLESQEDAASDREYSPMAGVKPRDDLGKPLFCPSPDVNLKADNFIARFRAGLKLEKINSGKGKSNLGPEANTN